MANPDANLHIPHIIGILLDAEGVANTYVIATNRRTGETQRVRADGNKLLIIDATNFPSGYLVDDVIEFNNHGSSTGTATITISNATGGFQEVNMDCAVAATTSVNL